MAFGPPRVLSLRLGLEGDVLEIEVGVGQAWNQHSNHCTHRNEGRGREKVQEAPSRSRGPSLAAGVKMEEG